jgi:hypothetical protein
MYEYDIVKLESGALADGTNLAMVQATVPLGADEEVDGVEQFGDIEVFSCLGVTSMPYPADDDGHAEGIVLRDCAGTDGVVIGARDERCTSVYGSLAPGDTCVHSTDADAAAQLQAKATRQVLLATKDSNGQNAILVIDGKNDKVQIAGFGGLIEMTKDSISLICPGGKSSFLMKDDTIMLVGKVILGGVTPTMNLASGTIAQLAAVLPAGLLPAPNVFVSAV